MEPTHASFFSGVGGLDLGLERAGWRTVSFSEIDPYASAVLAQRWPGVPNLGDILQVGAGVEGAGTGDHGGGGVLSLGVAGPRHLWQHATLWTGGFPCQDLSVAGKRRGLAGTRSGLAYAFLDLVGRHRPPLVLLENVPGLLSSHGGRDMAALLGALADLGYGVAYRVLDARHFGVPQRRRRVFIVGVRGGADDLDGRAAALRAASVLAVGTRCGRHPATGHEAGPGAAEGVGDGADRPGYGISHSLTVPPSISGRYDPNGETYVVGPIQTGYSERGHGRAGINDQYVRDGHLVVDGSPPDADRVRAPSRMARWMDGGRGVAATLNSGGNDGGFRTEPGEHLVVGTIREHVRPGSNTDHTVYVKASRYGEHGDPRRPDGNEAETWKPGIVSSSLDAIGHTARTATAVIGQEGGHEPDGLDSHRYRCCGNGVVAPVATWLGWRLRAAL